MQSYDIISINEISRNYPGVFTSLDKPPKEIFTAGNIGVLKRSPLLGIVGTRNPTRYGADITESIVSKVSRYGVPIVSGLAYGIDSIAHKHALEQGSPAVAVLPGSIGQIYPAGHRGLAEQIIQSGGLIISEYGTDEPPAKYKFIERNRLIAALSDVLVVIEAGIGSGSLYTAEESSKLGRVVVTVPGNIDSPQSRGTNNLIMNGARPLLDTSEILNLLGLDELPVSPENLARNEQERNILMVLEAGPAGITELQLKSGLDTHIYNVCLSMMELRGIININNGSVRICS